MAFSMVKHLGGLSRQLVAKAIQVPVRVSPTETFDLKDLFQREIASWHRSMTLRVGAVQRTVNKDLQEGRISLGDVANPARFIVNSIALHTLEQMMVSAGHFDNLHELRQAEWHDLLHKHVESIDI